jgi:hypothetical protein
MLSRRFSRLLVILVIFTILIGFAMSTRISADHRSIVVGSAQPSAVTSHSFQFDIPSTDVVGSIVLEYCNSPVFDIPCVAPTGLDLSAATLTNQSGNTGFSIDGANSTANKIVLTRAPVPGIVTSNSYVFNNVTNPSVLGSVFIRLSDYSSIDGSGTFIDKGAVAYAVQTSFLVGAYVPPFLKLCVGVNVTPNCSSATGNNIDLGILSSSRASAGQSQFSTATNDPAGYVIYALGETMTSGNNIIPALNTPRASFPGTPQFGINLRANLIPAVGQDPFGVGTGAPTPNYNIPNRFVFNSGDSIALSNIPSDYNRMTVSYLVNIQSKQPPGIYATTLTYVATVQF